MFSVVFLFIFFCGITSANQIPSTDLEEMDVVFRVGEFNLTPKYADSQLIKNEYKLKESPKLTVHIQKPTEFPQIIRPKQRFAIFLDDILSKVPQNGNDLLLTLKLLKNENSEYISAPIIEIKYNSITLFRQWITASPKKSPYFNILIPGKYHEKGRNVLEIRNIGKENAAFDALKIKNFSPYKTQSIKYSNKISKGVKHFAKEVASLAEKDKNLRDKSPRFLSGLILEHLNNKQKKLFPIQEFAALEAFYDPFTGKPILAYYCLPLLKLFFEGYPPKNPPEDKAKKINIHSIFYSRAIPCNVFPEKVGTPLSNLALISLVRNNKDTLTFGFKPSSSNLKKPMKTIIPVPWEGKTKVKIISGILPKKYHYSTRWLEQKNIKSKEYDIIGKVFEGKFTANELTVIRLEKIDGTSVKEIRLPVKPKHPIQPRFEQGKIKVCTRRPSPALFRYPNSIDNLNLLSCISSCFDISRNPGTKSNILKTKNVVPWNSKSLKLDIDFSQSRNFDEPWVNLNVNVRKGEIISFWVFPTTTSNQTEKVTFPFFFKDSQTGKFRFFSVKLKTNKWQRIILPEGKRIKDGNLKIIGIKKLTEFKKDHSVTFEFNGFSLISKEHPEYGLSGLKSKRILSAKEKLLVSATDKEPEKIIETQVTKLIFTGTPENYFEYRYAFSEPVKFHKVSALSKIKGIELIWHKDAQILEIKGKFPGKEYKVDDKLLTLLTGNEKKALGKGQITPIGIKLLYEK